MSESFELQVLGKSTRRNRKKVPGNTFRSKGLIFHIREAACGELASSLVVSDGQEKLFDQEFYGLVIAGVNGTITIEWHMGSLKDSEGRYVLEYDVIKQKWKIQRIDNHTKTVPTSEPQAAH